MAKKIYARVSGVARRVLWPYLGVYVNTETTPSGLPAGYTELDYIQSAEGQYIDTGLKPNQNTRVVMDFYIPSITNVHGHALFGARTSSTAADRFFFMAGGVQTNSGSWFYGYGGNAYTKSATLTGRHTVDVNKNTCTIDGVIMTAASATFSAPCNLTLLGCNDNGSINTNLYGAARVYSCKIYDGGTLVRNYIPCKNPANVTGLYDLVRAKFYANAGAGVFAAGNALGGIRIEGDLAQNVIKGYIGVKGVSRQFFEAAVRITNYSVGDVLKVDVDGTLTDFIVVHIGVPSAMYDSSCAGYWLMAKDLYTKDRFSVENHQNTAFKYDTSKAHSYLNDTFLNKLNVAVRSAIKEVRIPYTTSINPSAAASGSAGLLAKIFLPSACEIGTTDSYADGFAVQDGGRWDYFAISNKEKRIAYYAGVATPWWTRTGMSGQGSGALSVMANGDFFDYLGSNVHGYRPTFILPTTALVSDGEVIGVKE